MRLGLACQPLMNEQLSTTQLGWINGIWELSTSGGPLCTRILKRGVENKTSGFMALKLTGQPWEELIPNNIQQLMGWIRVLYRSLMEALSRSKGDGYLQVSPTRLHSQNMISTSLDCYSRVTKRYKK